MGAIGSYMKIAVNELEKVMREVGKEANANEIADIVQHHAITGAVAGVGSAFLPGAGAVVSTAAAATSILAMYVRLSKSLGVTFKEGSLKALASGIVADLSASVVTNLALAAVVSFIPGVGQMGAGVLCIIANYSMIYLAAYIFIKMLSTMFVSGKNSLNMSEYELKNMAKRISCETNLKDVVKEAKNQYKANK